MNVTPKRVVFENANTDATLFVDRIKKHGNMPLYAGGLFFDEKCNALLVKDDQDGERKKIWHKIPGGVSEDVTRNDRYLASLKLQLIKMKYGKSLLDEILLFEERNISSRNIAEKTLILELVEETGYYPVKFMYGMDGYRFNNKTREYDLLQVYYVVHSVVSPYSESLKTVIQHIAQVRTAEAIDKDVKEMRVVVPLQDLIQTLGPDTHKYAAEELCKKQAKYWSDLSDDPEKTLSKSDCITRSKNFAFVA